MFSPSNTSSALIVLGLAFSYLAFRFVRNASTSSMRYLPGPPNPHLLYGHVFDERSTSDDSVEAWVGTYGSTFKTKGLLSTDRLWTKDLDAIHHVLKNDDIYHKPEPSRYLLSRLLGNGVLVAEGAQHKLQRRVMNVAFGPSQIRQLTDIFYEKALLLRDIWSSKISDSTMRGNVESFDGLTKATLDIIGVAGFGYDFNALNNEGKTSELYEAFATLFKGEQSRNPWGILQAAIPALRVFPQFEPRAFYNAKSTMARIGNELLSEAKALQNGTGEKGDTTAKDLLSLLVRSNMNDDLPADQRMNDADVLAQVPTFIVAGHETTSTSTTWALYALSVHKDVQVKLRQELLNVATEQPSMDELNALPYLDAFVHETLRLFAPVPMTSRVATKDDIIPLKNPYTDLKGTVHDHIQIKKGQICGISIHAVSKDKTLWGPDASSFRPERWESIPEAVKAIPGVWGHLPTFSTGNHACIGFRFSLIEMKVLLFTLIRAFEVDLAVPVEDVKIKTKGIILRPTMKVDGKDLSRLPLVIKAVNPK